MDYTISPWLVYIFFKVDAIIFLFHFSAFICLLIQFWFYVDKDYDNGIMTWLYVGLTLVVVGTIIPNRETIAAIYLVPMMTSPEVVGPLTEEMQVLYNLFKDMLVNLAIPDVVSSTSSDK